MDVDGSVKACDREAVEKKMWREMWLVWCGARLACAGLVTPRPWHGGAGKTRAKAGTRGALQEDSCS